MRLGAASTAALALAAGALALACAGADADARRGDIRTLPAGQAVDLAGQSVPSRTTIFDFYAAWCAPCRTVGPLLEKLARSRPEEIALRKVDVVNWESDAAVKQGIEFLPYLAVVGPDGTVLATGDASYTLLKERFGLDLLAALRSDDIL